MEAAKLHPYLPLSLELPGFHPALMSMEFILGCYGGASALVVLVVWLASGPSLGGGVSNGAGFPVWGFFVMFFFCFLLRFFAHLRDLEI
jgi:hypothetical protein